MKKGKDKKTKKQKVGAVESEEEKNKTREKDKAEERDLENILKEEKQNKQIKVIVVFMAVLIVSVFLASWLVRESRKFEYAGLKFEKVMFDKLPLYYARIPITTATGSLVANYNLYLRNDPRKSSIPIEGKIKLMKNIVLAVNESGHTCQYSGVAGVTLGQFFDAARIKSIKGTTNLTESTEKNIIFADCENSDKNSVLIITESNETKITQKTKDCYIMEVANCEILEAVERFMLGAIAQSKGYEI